MIPNNHNQYKVISNEQSIMPSSSTYIVKIEYLFTDRILLIDNWYRLILDSWLFFSLLLQLATYSQRLLLEIYFADFVELSLKLRNERRVPTSANIFDMHRVTQMLYNR